MGTVLDGRAVAKDLREKLKVEVNKLKENGITPGLAVVLVGDDPASETYVRLKAKACEETGLYSEIHRLPASTTEEKLLKLIDSLNRSHKIHGILIQLPLPQSISTEKVLESVVPEKDVDGFHTMNIGKLFSGKPALYPCTPSGIMELLRVSNVDLTGKHAVVLGRSLIVGKPMAMMLLEKNATVTICHSATKNMEKYIGEADVVVSAMGRPGTVKGAWFKEGAVAIDVGTTRVGEKGLAGDIEFESAKKRCSLITPVPGGVGPMTIAMLLSNSVKACKQQSGK